MDNCGVKFVLIITERSRMFWLFPFVYINGQLIYTIVQLFYIFLINSGPYCLYINNFDSTLVQLDLYSIT